MRLTLLALLAASAFSQTVTWTHKTNTTAAGADGQIMSFYVPTLGGTYLRSVVNTSSSIYTTNDYLYTPGGASGTFTNLGGTGSLSDSCNDATISLTQPPDVHTDSQLAWDSFHNWVWLKGGLNQGHLGCNNWTLGNCSGVGSLGAAPACIFFANHLSTPTAGANDWHFVDPTTTPLFLNDSGTLVHDPLHNVLVGWGGKSQTGGGSGWPIVQYCSTVGNPTPGTLTTAQSNAGCASPDAYSTFFPINGVVNISDNGNGTSHVTWVSGDVFTSALTFMNIGVVNTPSPIYGTNYAVSAYTDSHNLTITGSLNGTNQNWFTHPLGTGASVAFWDTSTSGIYYFGGQFNLSINYNEIWKYDPATQKFSMRLNGSTCMPNQSGGSNLNRFAVAPSSSRNVFYMHNATGTGAPNDWVYDPVANTCSMMTTVGGGTTINSIASYDETAGVFITMGNATGNGNPFEIWTATISGASTTTGQFRSMATWPSGNFKHVEGCGVLSSLAAHGTASVTVNGLTSANFTIQEELYPGDQTGSVYGSLGGIARTNEPFCMDIPIADAANITSASSLSFTGTVGVASANMATNNVKCDGTSDSNFICVDTGAAKFQIRKANTNIIDDVLIGATHVVTSGMAATRGLILTGADPTLTYPANTVCTGGSSTCTTAYSSANDASSTCTIAVNGPVRVQIRCNGNLIDGASHVNMHHTTYLQFYTGETYVVPEVAIRNADFGSTSGDFATATKQLKSWKLVVPLSGSPTNFIIPSRTGDTNCSSAICTGTIAGTDGAYLYQGFSNFLQSGGIGSGGGWTADNGFTIQNNGSQITSGTTAQTPVGVADCSNGGGVGAAVGVVNSASEWPASAECVGSNVVLGMYSDHNGVISGTPTYPYIPWPQWKISRLFMEFHTSAPSSVTNDFLKVQLQLDGAPSVSYYNSTQVEVYPVPTPTQSDNLFIAAYTATVPQSGIPVLGNFCLGSPTPCMADYNTGINSNYYLSNWRLWGWSQTGGATSLDTRRANVLNYFSRGYTGRFLDSKFFWRYNLELSWPHSDGASASDSTVNSFLWKDKTTAPADSFGRPSGYTSVNKSTWYTSISGLTSAEWWDDLHFWWSGALNYYFLTGSELVKEALTPSKTWYLDTGAAQNSSNSIGITRGNAAHILTGSMSAEFWTSVGDSDGATILTQIKSNFTNLLLPDLCMQDGSSNLWPASCALPGLNIAGGSDPSGVSRVTGTVGTSNLRANNILYCANASWGGTGVGIRVDPPYMDSMTIDALTTLRKVAGPSYTHYRTINDILYGIAQKQLGQGGFSDDGATHWWGGENLAPLITDQGDIMSNSLFNGWRYSPPVDVAYQCPGGTMPQVHYATAPAYDAESFPSGGVWDVNTFAGGTQAGVRGSIFGSFLGTINNNGALTSDQLRKLYISMQWLAAESGQQSADFYSYQLQALAALQGSPSGLELQDLSFTLTPTGGSNYNISVTIPSGTTDVRIKYSGKTITNSGGFSSISPSASDGMLGFEPTVTRNFSLSPATYATWFGATDVSPSSFSIGANTFPVTMASSLTGANVSVKILAPPQSPPATSATGKSVSSKISIGSKVSR